MFKHNQEQQTELGSAKTSFIIMNMGSDIPSIDFSQAGLGTPIGGVLTDGQYDWQEGSVGNSVLARPLSITTLLFN